MTIVSLSRPYQTVYQTPLKLKKLTSEVYKDLERSHFGKIYDKFETMDTADISHNALW